jgi:hypothetical protein
MNWRLHILTRSDDPLPLRIIERQKEEGGVVEVVDLSAGAADYRALVEKIFAADSVAVW